MAPRIGRGKVRKVRGVRGDIFLIVAANKNRVPSITRHVPVKSCGVRIQSNGQTSVEPKTARVKTVSARGVIRDISSGGGPENAGRYRIDVYDRCSAQRDGVHLRLAERHENTGVRAKP